ncbi:MAG: pitrilysin family protein [Bacteroidota bacterium]|nr:insulinase family protein [Candidatus Kapabacteria bacterium]MDW8219989.1 pitrilysin family protein [Bacteroidota bacterium]
MIYHTLPNGLKAVIIPRTSVPIVSIAVSYGVGSYSELPTKTGFAHLFEHLMFEGSANLAHGMFDRLCSQAGGENNAYTTFDKTTYYMSLPAHRLELGLWLEADRMATCCIDTEALNIQKHVVLEEIKQNVENTPYGTYSRVLSATAFAPDSGYSWEVYGHPEHIAASTLDDVQYFFMTFYRPDNACLVVCGNVDQERTLSLVEQYFGAIPRGDSSLPRKPFDPAHRLGNRYACIQDTIPTDSLFCSYHCEGYTSPGIHIAEVLCSILSDGISSRLYKAMAYYERYASEVHAYVDDRRYTSLLTIYAISSGNAYSCDALYTSMWAVLDEVRERGVSAQELQKAKNRIRTRIARVLQRTAGIADEAAHYALLFDDPARVFCLADYYTSITAEHVQEYACKLFRRDNEVRIDFVPKPSVGPKHHSIAA